LNRAPRKAALRKASRALHEKRDVVAFDKAVNALLSCVHDDFLQNFDVMALF
jgi:hypothetical protein